MTKRHYKVSDGYKAATPYDTSFKSCICTMLTLIALTVVVLFFLLPWKHMFERSSFENQAYRSKLYHERKAKEETDKQEVVTVPGDKEHISKKYFEKMRESTTEPPTVVSHTIMVTPTKPPTTQQDSLESVTSASSVKSSTILRRLTTPPVVHTSTTLSKVTGVQFSIPSVYNASTSERNDSNLGYTTVPTGSEQDSDQHVPASGNMTHASSPQSVTQYSTTTQSSYKMLPQTSSGKFEGAVNHTATEVNYEFESTTSITDASKGITDSEKKVEESSQEKDTISTTEAVIVKAKTDQGLAQRTTNVTGSTEEAIETKFTFEERSFTEETEQHDGSREIPSENTEGSTETTVTKTQALPVIEEEDTSVEITQETTKTTSTQKTTEVTQATATEKPTEVTQATTETTPIRTSTEVTQATTKITTTEKTTEVTQATIKTTPVQTSTEVTQVTTKTTTTDKPTEVTQATTKTTPIQTSKEVTQAATKTTPLQTPTEVTQATTKTTPVAEKIETPTEAVPVEKENVCTTPECKVIASRMLSLVNHTIDPCEDFYVYACGGLRTSKTILEEDPSEDVISRVTRQLKSVTKSSPASYQRLKEFYESCMSYDQTVPMQERKRQAKEKFNEFGKMITAGNAEDLTDLLIKLFLNGSAPLFDIELDVDATDASKLAIVLTKPRLHSSYFQTATDNSKRCGHSSEDSINYDLTSAYADYVICKNNHSEFIAKTQKALEAFGAFEELGQEAAAKSIWDLRFSVETNILGLLATLSSELKIRETIISKNFKEYTVNDLQAKYKDIKWSTLFSTLFGRDVSGNTRVQLYFEEYFDNMFSSFNVIQPIKLHNTLLAVFAHNLYTDLVQTNSPCEREHYCFEVAGNLMPETVSNIYLTSFSESELQHIFNEAEEIFRHLIRTMREDVYDSKSRWLDEDSQNSVIQKLENMTFEVPHRFNETDLDGDMNSFSLNNTQYLLNAVTLTRLRTKQYFSMYGLNPRSPRVIWLLYTKSFSPDVAYIHNINTLAVPLIRLLPLNVVSIPKYIKMAKTGLAIGQGVGSAFTNVGLTFNINGLRGSIFSKNYDTSSYEFSMADCDMYYDYEHSYKEENKIYNFRQEGSLTKHNRLYDITGTNAVLETEQKDGGFKTKLLWGDFSPMKTFFLLLAQEFCSKKGIPETFQALYEDEILPPAFRVKNIMANSKEFVNTFNCLHGSSMNNQVKCAPFPKLQMYEDEYVRRDLRPDLKRRYYQLLSHKINNTDYLKDIINKYKSGTVVSSNQGGVSKANKTKKYEALVDLYSFLSQHYSINSSSSLQKRNAVINESEGFRESTTHANNDYHHGETTTDQTYTGYISSHSDGYTRTTESFYEGLITNDTESEDLVNNGDSGFLSDEVASKTGNHHQNSVITMASVDDSLNFDNDEHNFEATSNNNRTFPRYEASNEDEHDNLYNVSDAITSRTSSQNFFENESETSPKKMVDMASDSSIDTANETGSSDWNPRTEKAEIITDTADNLKKPDHENLIEEGIYFNENY